MNRLNNLMLLALTIGAAACGIEGSSPVPQPLPGYLRRSTPSDSRQETLVLGLQGAVAGQGKVHLRELNGPRLVVAPSSAQGSFAAAITVGLSTALELSFENADGISDWLALPPSSLSYGPVLAGSRGPGVVSAPDAGGIVTVSNDGGAGQPPLLTASPESDLLVANATQGTIASGRTDSKGVFRVQLPAARGDLVQLLLVDSKDPGATSDYLSFSVP
jgi:hypothetical protein